MRFAPCLLVVALLSSPPAAAQAQAPVRSFQQRTLDEADGRVDVHVHFEPPPPSEPTSPSLPQLLLETQGWNLGLLSTGPTVLEDDILGSVRSLLRLGQLVYITVGVRPRQKTTRPWRLKLAQLLALHQGGASTLLPVTTTSALAPEGTEDLYVLEATLPAGATHLHLSLAEEGPPESSRTLRLPPLPIPP